jgi:hypothetical protein
MRSLFAVSQFDGVCMVSKEAGPSWLTQISFAIRLHGRWSRVKHRGWRWCLLVRGETRCSHGWQTTG